MPDNAENTLSAQFSQQIVNGLLQYLLAPFSPPGTHQFKFQFLNFTLLPPKELLSEVAFAQPILSFWKHGLKITVKLIEPIIRNSKLLLFLPSFGLSGLILTKCSSVPILQNQRNIKLWNVSITKEAIQIGFFCKMRKAINNR